MKKSREGFTLAELLIVVAIIAVLVVAVHITP
jgi:prepilin-type N-terminal cleavage/methylation domain-containing protein